MRRTTRNLLAVAGVISAVTGIVLDIPSILQGNYLVATGATTLLVGGLVLLAIALGE